MYSRRILVDLKSDEEAVWSSGKDVEAGQPSPRPQSLPSCQPDISSMDDIGSVWRVSRE